MLFCVLLLVVSVFCSSDDTIGVLSKTYDKADTSCSDDVNLYGYYSTDICYTFDGKVYFKNILNVVNNTFFIYIYSDEKCESLMKSVNDYLYECFVDPVTHLPMTNELLSSVVALETMSVVSSDNRKTMVKYSGSDCTGDIQWAMSNIFSGNCTSVDCESGQEVICGQFVV